MTPPPGADGGLANAIVGSVMMSAIAVAGRHAARPACRHLSRRIWPPRAARLHRALRQRHPAQRAVDRHRPLHLRDRRRQRWAISPAWAGRCVADRHRHSRRRAHDREHAAAGAQRLARGRRRARRAAQLRHPRRDLARGARRHRHRRAARHRAHLGRDRAAALHRARTTSSGAPTSTQPMASLPVVIFQFAMSPYEDWHRLAWAGALLITATVLTLSIVARVARIRSGVSHGRQDRHRTSVQGRYPRPVVLLRREQGAEEHHRAALRPQGDRVHRPVGLRQVHAAARPQPHLRALSRTSAPRAK